MTTATVLVRLVLSFCAFELTEYPWRRAIAKVRSFVAGLTSGLSLNARETVGFETFASRAMSSIVVRSIFRAGIAVLAVVVETLPFSISTIKHGPHLRLSRSVGPKCPFL